MERKKEKKAVLPTKIRKVETYIEKHFSSRISLRKVASIAGMNKCSFCRRFKQVTQMSFSQYLNSLRLEEAKKLLLTSDTYISQIAFKVGFQNADHFRHLFTEYCGCSPTEYRDRFRGLAVEKEAERCKYSADLQT